MKLPKSPKIYIILGILAVVLIVSLKFMPSLKKDVPPQVTTPKMMYDLKPLKTDLKVGETISVPLYMSGEGADASIAFDIRIDYDKSKFKLVKATPGGYLEKYMTVKWDLEEAWFALALSPSTPKTVPNPTLPILTLDFKALQKSNSTSVTTGVTTVYVSKTGGFHPQSSSRAFTIK